jgi:hypothetical protein
MFGCTGILGKSTLPNPKDLVSNLKLRGIAPNRFHPPRQVTAEVLAFGGA